MPSPYSSPYSSPAELRRQWEQDGKINRAFQGVIARHSLAGTRYLKEHAASRLATRYGGAGG